MNLKQYFKNQNGFTLMELMVAIVIVGIMATMIVPQYTGMLKKAKMQSYIEDLASGINVARAEAMSQGQRAIIATVALGQGAIDFDSDGSAEHYFIFLDTDRDNDYDAGETVLDFGNWDDAQITQNTFEPCPAIANTNCLMITTIGTATEDSFPAGGGDLELRVKFDDDFEACVLVTGLVASVQTGEVLNGTCITE